MWSSIYLAGPSVFRPDAQVIGARFKDLCDRYGLEALYPSGNEVAATGLDAAKEIFVGNCGLIRQSSAVVADISPFRGPHMDPGTAWEIGYAAALGRPVFAYTSSFAESEPTTMRDRIACERSEDSWRDANGDEVEDFGLPENLMIGCSIVSVSISAEAAIKACAEWLATTTTP